MRPHALAPEFLLLAIAFAAPAVFAQSSDERPTLTGLITRITSQSDFDVNANRIIITPTTSMGIQGTYTKNARSEWPTLRLGQTIHLYGKLDRKHHTLTAVEIWVVEVPNGDHATVFGAEAVIDFIPAPSPTSAPNTLLIRADGNLILITPSTVLTSKLSDPSLNGIHTNTLITYNGIRRPDGSVLAKKVSIRPNIIERGESNLLSKTKYDPGQVNPNAKQNGTSKLLKGLNPQLIPPYVDAAMQARIDRIGASLIPAYQRALPESDPAKLNFRFQLVDTNWPDAWALPSGVILIPHQIVDLLQNDSQLAELLAANIAYALEKWEYRQAFDRHVQTATDIAFAVLGGPVGAVEGIYALTSGSNSARLNRPALQQSDRVSLSFMNDAGYDITEAPHTWWLLNSTGQHDLADIPIPNRAFYLYETIADAWPTQAAAP